jgi:hypothetical protein
MNNSRAADIKMMISASIKVGGFLERLERIPAGTALGFLDGIRPPLKLTD